MNRSPSENTDDPNLAERKRPPTLYDIAKRAQTSPTTVSLVLNNKWRDHRIKPETAAHVERIAAEANFSVNLQARGLRLARSGLAGMIVPNYQNRFFSGLSERFEEAARSRGLCPAVISTRRDPEREHDAVTVLLAQKVESLFIVGASDPGPLDALCRQADTPHINLDIPGDGTSVVSDNPLGAYLLASRLLQTLAETQGADPADLVFIGGYSGEYATSERIKGFSRAMAECGYEATPERIITCGYSLGDVEDALSSLYGRLGRLPAGLFVNSIEAFEGAVQFIKGLPSDEFIRLALGCFDWNPFAAFLPIPVIMVRQDVSTMVERAFEFIDGAAPPESGLVHIPPVLVDPR
ncbi:MAG: LacI family DNA-binding transcriptional regulator [Pseudomonadota bacterium]